VAKVRLKIDLSALGGLAEMKALQARLDHMLEWFSGQGIELKGLAPVLVDFPAELDGESVRLCWLEGETELAGRFPGGGR